jgi:transposase
VRGSVKALGGRLPKCSTDSFVKTVADKIPEQLTAALSPVLDTIAGLSAQIRDYDGRVERLCEEKYPEAKVLAQPKGVGALTALAYVLTIEDPARFPKSRSVGSYVGLRPRQSQSGALDPQLHITKAGDDMLRRLLVGSAHYILGPFGPDTDLRRWGLKLAATGGKAAKKRAVVAVARKLSVLLLRLWVTGEVYEPLRNAASGTETVCA